MTSLTSLIERIEAATEGSRELDAEIALAMNLPREAFGPVYDQRGMIDGPEYHVEKGTWSGNGMTWRAPDFSTSIDAALTLLPEGHSYTLGDCNEDNVPWACVTRCAGTWPDFAATGADVVLALLSAILRARQTEPRHDES